MCAACSETCHSKYVDLRGFSPPPNTTTNHQESIFIPTLPDIDCAICRVLSYFMLDDRTSVNRFQSVLNVTVPVRMT